MMRDSCRHRRSRPIARLGLAAGLAFGWGAAEAQASGVAGDWSCGATQLFITGLGSIEVMADGQYRAGLYKREGNGLRITWDRGGVTRVTTRVDGDAMTVEGLPGGTLTCRARR